MDEKNILSDLVKFITKVEQVIKTQDSFSKEYVTNKDLQKIVQGFVKQTELFAEGMNKSKKTTESLVSKEFDKLVVMLNETSKRLTKIVSDKGLTVDVKFEALKGELQGYVDTIKGSTLGDIEAIKEQLKDKLEQKDIEGLIAKSNETIIDDEKQGKDKTYSSNKIEILVAEKVKSLPQRRDASGGSPVFIKDANRDRGFTNILKFANATVDIVNNETVITTTGGGGGGASSLEITQTAHGFVVLDWLYFDDADTTYKKAKADSETTLGMRHVVEVVDANTFKIAKDGVHEITNVLTVGEYVLSPDTAGAYTQTIPGDLGDFILYGMEVVSSTEVSFYTVPAIRVGTELEGTGTTNEIAYWVDADTLGALAVATYPSLTELSYVKGVTSSIQTQLGLLQARPTVVTGNITASNDSVYIVTASATLTDPTPAEGKGFMVIVRNGTATVGGTGYAVAGSEILRIYHSGAWANYLKTPSSGVNTGDQTSIVGITGTITEFNTACTDADFAILAGNTFTGDNIQTTGTANVYNTGSLGNAFHNLADKVTNYERFRAIWSGNIFYLRGGNGGTGVTRSVRLGASATGGDTLGTGSYFEVTNGTQFTSFVRASGSTTFGHLFNSGAMTTSSGLYSHLRLEPVINQSSTAGYSAILVNPTETSTGSGVKALFRGQVGGTDKILLMNDGSIELGHATDTTISRSSAGVIAVEGVIVPTVSSSSALTNKSVNGVTLVSGGTATKYLSEDGTYTTPAGGSGGGFWTAVPGSPTRTGNTTFTLTDTSNANLYDLLLCRGTVLKWTETSTLRQAMIVSATYATNTVTVTIIGDTMTSIDASSLKYGLEKARVWKFAIAGTIGATGTNMANTVMVETPAKVYGCDFWAGTAGSGTTTLDINKGGTTMFATKPSILTTTQSILGVTADTATTATTGDFITIDIDATAGTTKIIDAYVNLYRYPLYSSYLA